MTATYDAIARTTLSSSTASVTFSSIPSTFTDLVVIVNCFIVTTGNPLYIRFNGTSSGYSWTHMFGNGTNVISNRAANASFLYMGEIATLSTPSLHQLDIMNYSSNNRKMVLGRYSNNRSTAGLAQAIVGYWQNTAAISSIEIGTFQSGFNMATGTTLTVYGIRRA